MVESKKKRFKHIQALSPIIIEVDNGRHLKW